MSGREPELRCHAPSRWGLCVMLLVMAGGFGAFGTFLHRIGVAGPAVFLGVLALVGLAVAFKTRPRTELIVARPSGLELRLPGLRRRVEWSEVRDVQPRALQVNDPQGRPLFVRYSAEVTLADGARFVVEQDWDGHQAVLGCILLRRFDPRAWFDLPSQSLAATIPENVPTHSV